MEIIYYDDLENSIKNQKCAAIILHGYRSNAYNLVPLSNELKKRLPFISFFLPNAPFCFLENNAQIFSTSGPKYVNIKNIKSTTDDRGYFWYELESIWEDRNKMSAENLNAVKIIEEIVGDISETFGISKDRFIIIGFSQGAMISISYSLNTKVKPIACVSYAGKLLDTNILENNITKFLLLHGNNDDVVLPNELFDASNNLDKLNISCETYLEKGAYHEITSNMIDKTEAFIKKLTI